MLEKFIVLDLALNPHLNVKVKVNDTDVVSNNRTNVVIAMNLLPTHMMTTLLVYSPFITTTPAGTMKISLKK